MENLQNEINKDFLIQNKNLTEQFIEKYINKDKFDDLDHNNVNLSLSFFEKYKNKIKFDCLLESPVLVYEDNQNAMRELLLEIL